jgi:LmbE family N-acetylglucosaminyl deacetylase
MTVVAYFTSGESSHRGRSGLDPADVAALRQAEARNAMASIGLPADRVRFCGAPDGRLDKLSPAERRAWGECLARLVDDTRPSEILLPCRNDGSTEHEAMFALLPGALAALPFSPPRVLEYPVWAWWSPRHLARVLGSAKTIWRSPTQGFAKGKRTLLRCYPSQTDPSPPYKDPILPRGFVDAFDTDDEFFFETPLPKA